MARMKKAAKKKHKAKKTSKSKSPALPKPRPPRNVRICKKK